MNCVQTKREINTSVNQFGNNFLLKWEMVLKNGNSAFERQCTFVFFTGLATSVQSPLKLPLNWFCKWHQKGKNVVLIPFTIDKGTWRLMLFLFHDKGSIPRQCYILNQQNNFKNFVLNQSNSFLILLSQGGLYILGHVQEDEFNSQVRKVFFKICFCFCFLFT